MDDGTILDIHKPGITFKKQAKGGNGVRGRYPARSPIKVCVEIPDLPYMKALNLEGKMLAIMRLPPWFYKQYFHLGHCEKAINEAYEEQKQWEKEWKAKNGKAGSHDFLDEIWNKRRAKAIKQWVSQNFAQPIVPDSWEENFGMSEWRIWDQTDEELVPLVHQLLEITWEEKYPDS